ncbi:MAG: NAD(P)H-dependent oxidoreductase [Caulobacteraceae bacterium]
MAHSSSSRGKHALIVLAHPEPRSFNAQQARVAEKTLIAQGYTVEISDLYGAGFDPAESPRYFHRRENPAWFKPANEQKHAHDAGSTDPVIAAEIEKLDRADLLILQFPFWWYMAPAMLKGWFDRVLTYGGVYSSRQRFDTGRFRGKRALLSVTLGSTETSYLPDGRNGDISLLLWPIQFSLHYVGYQVLSPYLAYLPTESEEEIKGHFAHLAGHLRNLDRLPTVPFNGPEHWGEDDRLKPGAPSFSLMSRQTK